MVARCATGCSSSLSGYPGPAVSLVSVAVLVMRLRAIPAFLRAHPFLAKGLQLALVLATLGFCAWAVRTEWSKAAPLLEHASPAYIGLALGSVALYYLVFVLGWIRILAAWEIDITYRVA